MVATITDTGGGGLICFQQGIVYVYTVYSIGPICMHELQIGNKRGAVESYRNIEVVYRFVVVVVYIYGCNNNSNNNSDKILEVLRLYTVSAVNMYVRSTNIKKSQRVWMFEDSKI